MPLKIKLQTVDGGSELLARIAEKISSRQPLHAVLGKRGEVEARAHFDSRSGEANKMGWQSLGFWSRIRTATAFTGATEAGAKVVISDPAINQKIFGGRITPKEGKYLAIPAIAEAYGKSPRIFDFLFVRRFHSGAMALVETDRTLIKIGRKRKNGSRKISEAGRSKRGRVWYWLARSVTQAADPRALPAEQQFQAALLEEAREYLDRLAEG